MSTAVKERIIGAGIERLDGREKVSGEARYAYEYHIERVAYLFPIQSTIARGRVTGIDASAAARLDGVLFVLSHENAPKLASVEDPSIRVIQSPDVAYHGQFVGGVVAETLELARQAAALVSVTYDAEKPDVVLSPQRPDLYTPETVNPSYPSDTHTGDVERALSSAAVRIDCTYTTPYEHNMPMEPHATIAQWDGDDAVTLYDANQGPHGIRADVAAAFGLDPERVRVIAQHVGGGFGSKLFTHPHVILTVMAAKLVGRPVKLALTRQQMFSVVGYRTMTIQRLQMGAHTDGRLTAIAHDVIEQTSKLEEFAEQTATVTRMMYAAPNRRTSHRLARLDVPTPTIMRAPGECPGSFGLESAMDEMALACGLDPIEFRVRNEPLRDPDTHRPFSSRNLIACMREGARRFGWTPREREPRRRREGRWLVGTGVAASTYPTRVRGSNARVRIEPDGIYRVELDAVDIGTGTWTALSQIAADALGVSLDRVRLRIGDSTLPKAPGAGGSMGLVAWGSAIVEAGRQMRERLSSAPNIPTEGIEVNVETGRNPNTERYAMHAYGAQFVEVRVDADTCEIRVPRMLGIFAVGQVINAKTARSQLIGGMTMGLSMALMEESVMDETFGYFANHDFAEYHIAANADVCEIDADWIEEHDELVNAMGAKGIGEIGITGTAAAIANAVFDATGVRVRELPIKVDSLLYRVSS